MSFNSPKRKRHGEEWASPANPPTLLTRFPHVPPDANDDGGGSPRTKAAGKFQQLHISQYDLNQSQYNDLDGGRPSKRPHFPDDEIMESSQESEPVTERTPVPERTAPGKPIESQAQSVQQPVPSAQEFTFERAMSTVFPQGETPRPKSPSLKGEISDQYWHESEITGHDPDDPEDDGYGINGIGFKPTSAMAYARTQKRKQQIAEYRSREAKEARTRRSERRRVGSAETRMESPTLTPTKSRVRFEDAG